MISGHVHLLSILSWGILVYQTSMSFLLHFILQHGDSKYFSSNTLMGLTNGRKEKPVRTEDELIIDKIEYDGSTIFLSDNLNTIIGGRSTGKSTLLNSIAYKLENNEAKDKHTFKDMENFHVFWKDGE